MGGLVATFCASLLNSLGPGVVIAPFVEEVLKVAGVVVVLRIFGVGTPIRGFVVGYLVGAAFECYENFLYIPRRMIRTAVSRKRSPRCLSASSWGSVCMRRRRR